ncbi:hypothetical protein GCM10009682_02980 [Luedemannella flava]|uniref:Uncharacterized protein n=1 Tax=Luedemannella flava TaxID=349316 RepID=A0ABN2LD76_9ACTN
MATDQPAPTARDRQWLLTLLPAFPLLLLVLRLWYLSRQDLPTMLLLVQYVNPLGLVSALLITLVWVLPVVVLVVRAMGLLLRVSDRSAETRRSWLARASHRIPDWVVVIIVALAALTWQMRFLPTLLMLAVAILGLTMRVRHRDEPRIVRTYCVIVPIVVAGVAYAWLAGAIIASVRAGEFATAFLLVVPPALTPLLTGPVPARFARLVTHWPATVAAVCGPVLVGAIFLRVPVLPNTAIELVDSPDILLGSIVTIDDQMTTMLAADGTTRFVPNADVRSRTLCPDPEVAPASVVAVHGWPVEQTALEWIAPSRPPSTPDPRCLGRPASEPRRS